MIYKLLSETLLSLYPSIVKLIDLPLLYQLWNRLLIFTIIPFIAAFTYIKWNTLFTPTVLLVALSNIIHIFTSYYGFLYLPSGVAYTLFYLHPIFIMMLTGGKIGIEFLLAMLGTYIISSDKITGDVEVDNRTWWMAVGAIIIAAFTESTNYLLSRKLPTTNIWYRLFLIYFWGCLAMTVYMFARNTSDKTDKTVTKDNSEQYRFNILLLLNAFIGLFGYYLWYYSAEELSPKVFSILSYFGIITAYIFGYIFNNESIKLNHIIGTILIILSGYLVKNK